MKHEQPLFKIFKKLSTPASTGCPIPSWTFFNSPFQVDFKAIQFVIIWGNLDRDIAKILKGSHLKN